MSFCWEKHEPQDAHFNSNQTSLHNTIVYPANDSSNITYAYHLSDIKIHNSIFVAHVTNDLLQKFPEVENFPIIRFKSDNCPAQYCCKYVFPFYLDLANKLNKPVLVYYGVNGHGWGMVDGMSSFGVQAPVRRAVVTSDFYYGNTEELVTFLKAIRKNNNFYYKLLDKELFLGGQEEREMLKIKGCLKARMMSFLPSGEYQLKRHMWNCESCLFGDFGMCKLDGDCERVDVVEYDEEIDCLDDDNDDDDEGHNSHSENMFTFVEEGSFIALYSTPNSFENFLICKVKNKGIADEDLVDFYGHIVKSGDKFITGVYLEKVNQKKEKVFYKYLKKNVYIYPGEMFCPAVAIHETDLSISIEDYQFLCDSI